MQTAQKITGKTIAAFFDQIQGGTRLTCLDNTYNENAPGISGIVGKVGKTSIMLMRDDSFNTFWLNRPKRVGDVVDLTHNTITYKIGRDEHTATWRIDGKDA